MDGLGNEILPPQFNQVSYEFSDDIILVEKDGLYGYVDNFGHYLVEPCFEDAYDFCGDVAVVKKNGLYGYIDRCGNYVIEPCFDREATTLKEVLRLVKEKFISVKK